MSDVITKDDDTNNININRIIDYDDNKIFTNLEELYDYKDIISDTSIFQVTLGSYTGALSIGTYKIINCDDIFKKYENKADEIIINCECLSERTYNNKIAFRSDSPTTNICNNNNIEIVCEKEKGYLFTTNHANKVTIKIVKLREGGKIKNIHITKSRKSRKSIKTKKSRKTKKNSSRNFCRVNSVRTSQT